MGSIIDWVEGAVNTVGNDVKYVVNGIEHVVDAANFWTEIGAILGTAVGVVVAPEFVVPEYMLGGFVVGGVVGAIVDSMVRLRELSYGERFFANSVFAGSVPFDRVVLSDDSGQGGRSYTTPSFLPGSDKIVLHIGPAFDDPFGFCSPAYPRGGQLLIHELTHAWQIAHWQDTGELICDGIWNQAQYIFCTRMSTRSRTARIGPTAALSSKPISSICGSSMVPPCWASFHHSSSITSAWGTRGIARPRLIRQAGVGARSAKGCFTGATAAEGVLLATGTTAPAAATTAC